MKLFHLSALLFLAPALLAQSPLGIPAPSARMNPALEKLFGETDAFTAKATAQILDKQDKQSMSMSMNVALLDGKFRTEVDMSQMKGAQMPPDALDGLKQMGMDKMINITRPDKKTMYLIYPGLKAYAEMPLEGDDVPLTDQDFKVEKTSLGKETIDGHPCVKNKVVITDKKGTKMEATTWNATDLKDFPIQTRVQEQETAVVTRYKDIQLKKPEAQLFEPPTGYTKYGTMQELMQSAVQKMLGSGQFK